MLDVSIKNASDNFVRSKWEILIYFEIRKYPSNYNKAWKAREFALSLIRGSPEESYSTLPSHCYVLEQKNLGTITNVVNDHDNQFKYFFYGSWCFFSGFHISIRFVITTDGTFFKAKYLRTLFVATCNNDNNQIYPLCFRIDDFENDASWEWLFRKLHRAIGQVDDLVVVPNHHNNIEKIVQIYT